ncbi:phosphorothioated DNA-binding restriction endonuclease [Desulfonatronovibrio magnus]|uniref:phosphorothioated DNA-binding restriction endonuclease n=1 Tax=Desulfonatronovibrio magnus TaxID=698827 RepID=UPI0005EB420E|nr:HNH endonuclease [Desulfonatronovibrio magnus]
MEIVDKFKHITVWKRGGKRAPHKPLLVLYAIGCLLRNQTRLISYEEIEKRLKDLLMAFGPASVSLRTEYPFWRLQNDNLWKVENSEMFRLTSSGDPLRSELINLRAYGGFKSDVFDNLKKSTQTLKQVIEKILYDNFPESIQEDILQAVGIDLEDLVTKARRNPLFRSKILRAYENRCAVCGFDVRLDYYPIALEAAHIKWHQAGGPDEERNGIALCTMHHKLFDRGAFTLSGDMEILVSDRANGTCGFNEWLMNFHGKKIQHPQRITYLPHQEFVAWHVKQVFQGDYRAIGASITI